MKTRTLLTIIVAVAALLACVPWTLADEDSRIESAIKNSYVFKTHLKSEGIKVESKDGKVTLSGNVSDESYKDMAQDVAQGIPGVKNVDNKIEVKGEKHEPASDGWISMKVKAMLLFHRNVSGTKTKVHVKDGIVTLQGEAESEAQKDLTTQYAKDIEGVKEVKNEMTVSKFEPKNERTMGEVIDDSSITVQLKWALLTHRSTSSIRTKIDTKDGVVTITGVAKNAAEKDLVTKLAEDINGVKKVINNMTIEATAGN